MSRVDLRTIRRELPDYHVVSSFDAALARFRLRVETKVLFEHRLSVIARFFLRAIALGVDEINAVAHLLGLDTADLADAGSELLQADLVTQGEPTVTGGRRLQLTQLGRRHVEDRDEHLLLVPRRRTIPVHFDPFTRSLDVRDRDVLSLDEVRKNGVFVIHPPVDRPHLGDLRRDDLQRVASEDMAAGQRYEIVSITKLASCDIEYLSDCVVYVLKERSLETMKFAVLRRGAYLSYESAALDRLFADGKFSIPNDANPNEQSENDVRRLLPESVTSGWITDQAVLVHRAAKASHEVREEIERREELLTGTDNHEERDRLMSEIEELKGELERSIQQVDELRVEVASRDNSFDFLLTEEHRDVLKRALREADNEVIIISPWMNRRTMDPEIMTLISDAAKRGVRIMIGHGISDFNRSGRDEQQRAEEDVIKAQIYRYLREPYSSNVVFHRVGGTHQKILICDRKFAVCTSFNWLSYRGDLDREYRLETGVLLTNESAVARLAEEALRAFNFTKPVPPRMGHARQPT